MKLDDFLQAVTDHFNQKGDVFEGDTNTLMAAGRAVAQVRLTRVDDCLSLIKQLHQRGIKVSLEHSLDADDDKWAEILGLLIGETVATYLEKTDSKLRKISQERLERT